MRGSEEEKQTERVGVGLAVFFVTGPYWLEYQMIIRHRLLPCSTSHTKIMELETWLRPRSVLPLTGQPLDHFLKKYTPSRVWEIQLTLTCSTSESRPAELPGDL